MTLNVKLSLAICLGFIVSMTWLLGQVSRPVETIPSPLVARATTWGDWIIPPMVDERPEEAVYAAADGTAEPSFAHPSARERSAQAAHAAAPPSEAKPNPFAADESETSLPPVVATATPPANTSPALAAEPESQAPAEPRPPTAVLAARSTASQPQSTEYVIESGDTLIAIAEEFFDTAGDDEVALILAANPHLGGDPDRIHAGQTIEIPVPSRPLARSSAGDDAAGGRVATAAAMEAPREEDSGPHYYTVRKNDSLSRIARRLLGDESRWKEIKRLNGIEQSGRIYPGMVIKLPEAPVFAGGPNMRT
jgi:nucleoid-associated protein YgaU